MQCKNLLLIITGSVAAYKSLELIRRLREHDITITTILTKGGAEFVTPLSVASLSEQPVYSDLFSLKDETEMGHIRLSRENDLICIAPASADFLAKMASGRADCLASAVLLATDSPVLAAPAMNHRMWEHPATQRNIAQLEKDGITFIEPESGEMACGESGTGRMAEIDDIRNHILNFKRDNTWSASHTNPERGRMYDSAALSSPHGMSAANTGGKQDNSLSSPHGMSAANTGGKQDNSLSSPHGVSAANTGGKQDNSLSSPHGVSAANTDSEPLHGLHAIVTAGPTFEAIDPVRFLGNRSSGKQGYAIAEALAAQGAHVTLVSGPTNLPSPAAVQRVEVESAAQMMDACLTSLPADIFIGAAAVADWQVASVSATKLKKRDDHSPPSLTLTQTPDIVHHVAMHSERPSLVIGFAAETIEDNEQLLETANAKRTRKQCDWLLANDVSDGSIFGDERTRLHLLTDEGCESWPDMPKSEAATLLAERIASHFNQPQTTTKVTSA